MMKLCLIAPVPPPYGGVANWERIIVNEIVKHDDIDFTLINIAANKRPLDGRTIFDRIFYSGFVMLKAYRKLKEAVRKNCPDVVHMTTSGGMGFYRDLLFLKYLKKKQIPSVYHVHFGRTVQYRNENKRSWKMIIKAVSLADAVIVLDEKSLELLNPYTKKIVKINNPIDTENYKTLIKNGFEKPTIIYIGWVIKTKGVEELLSAFHVFNQRHGHAYTLELIGPGESDYIQGLKEVSDIENVIFTGEIGHNEAMMRLASASVFILPSYTEGFPNVVLEAMALKKCIIATNVGALPEVLDDNAGIIINSKSAEEILNALERTEDRKLRERLAENAYIKVNDLYDVKPTYEKYRKLWRSVINDES